MNTITDIVLGTIRAQICGQQYHVDGNISEDVLNEVYAFSCAQDIVHLVATELFSHKVSMSQETRDRYKKQQILGIYRYERMHQEYMAICRVLEEAGIPYMPLKGAVMRQYYPEPWMRTSSDIDILVKSEDIPAATDALVSALNYENRGALEHDVQMLSPSGVHLELHFETIEDYHLGGAHEVLSKLWDEHAVVSSGYCYVMSNEMFYFYHIAHMAKHFQEGGCGIRFFMDMWLLNHSVKYDKTQRDALLRKGGLLEFAKSTERLSEVWFGGQPHDTITARIESYVLNGGIYGSRDNNMTVKHVKKGGRFGYAMYLVFRPRYELGRQYPILYKHKWLYPFCQIYRWICLIFNGGISRAEGLLNRGADAYEESGDNVEQMLKDLNLTSKKVK